MMFASAIAVWSQEPPSIEARLQALYERYPQADADGDGTLTPAEAREYQQKMRGQSASPAGEGSKGQNPMPGIQSNPDLDREGSLAPDQTGGQETDEAPPRQTEMVAMRDGVRLATDFYLPQGDGPWPAIVLRTPYDRRDRKNWARYSGYLAGGYAYVVQDWRGLFESEGKFRGLIPEEMQADGYDTVEWIASQPWCNGKVGIVGGSGPGVAAKMAALSNPPHLLAVSASVTALRPEESFGFNGGVLRTLAKEWMAQRGMPTPDWPKPHLWSFPRAEGFAAPTLPQPVQAAILDVGGWFDVYVKGTLDDFMLMNNGKYRLVMMAKGHGVDSLRGLEYPDQKLSEFSDPLSWFDYWLKGVDNGAMDTPAVRYFVMGDALTPGAPGNEWRSSDRWPVPHTPLSFYFTKDGALRIAPPEDEEAKRTYAYDPRDPIPTIGGSNTGENQGPLDQRPLKNRADILRFASAPLEKPLEIAGQVLVELFVDSDVADTTFMAKLIDVYPNGYEALMLDSAIMARYWNGFDAPSPLKKGEIHSLTIDLFSTALVFDAGHRVAVHIASSNSPRYEVHPNSYEPANSYDESPVANNSVHVSSRYPSRLILPAVGAERQD